MLPVCHRTQEAVPILPGTNRLSNGASTLQQATQSLVKARVALLRCTHTLIRSPSITCVSILPMLWAMSYTW
jgi:hypothetical protein